MLSRLVVSVNAVVATARRCIRKTFVVKVEKTANGRLAAISTRSGSVLDSRSMLFAKK